MKKKYFVIALIVVVCLSIPTFFVLKHYLSDRETINRRFGVKLPDSFSVVEYYKDSGYVTAAKIKCSNEEDVEKFIKGLLEYKSIQEGMLTDEVDETVEGNIAWWDIDKDHLKGAYEKEFTKKNRTKTLGWMRIYITNDNEFYMIWYY